MHTTHPATPSNPNLPPSISHAIQVLVLTAFSIGADGKDTQHPISDEEAVALQFASRELANAIRAELDRKPAADPRLDAAGHITLGAAS